MEKLEAVIKKYGDSATKFINDKINSSTSPKTLKETCLYSVNAGGKRIRPAIFLITLGALNVQINEKHIAFASALEMIHTYSLIHDDLPAMDNDDYRRGQLTSHKRFGEAYAILAGDALLNLAFETMLEYCVSKKDIAAAKYISKASGYEGMVGGQVMDMDKLDRVEDILDMYALKTGALLKASIVAPAIMAGCSKGLIEKLSCYAENIGVAFQLKDDLIDKTNINKHTGKPKDSDERNDKSTYLSKIGIKASQLALHEYTQNALKSLNRLDECFDMLRNMANFMDDREK